MKGEYLNNLKNKAQLDIAYKKHTWNINTNRSKVYG